MATDELAPPLLIADAPLRATRVRYGVLAFLCTLSLVLYLDRICMGIAKLPIQEELGLSNTALGLIDMAFMVSYGLFEMPIGHWGDRHGSRGVLTRIVVCWSTFTALTGAMFGFWSLMIVRFLFGAGEAGAFPNAARVVARWFPGRSRGPAQGLVTASAQIGGAFAPIVAAYLIEWVGWRWTFLIFGMVGIVWAVAFYAWFRDDPAEHSGVSDAERQLLAPGAPTTAAVDHPPIPWRLVLRNPTVWLLGAAMNCGAFAFYMYVFWFPKYLAAARGVVLTNAGLLSSTILIGGAIGCVLGGFIGNWVLLHTNDRRLARRIVGCGGFAAASLSLFVGVHCDSPVAVSIFTALALLCGQVQLASWWAVASDISGKHLGALFGLMNSMGAIGGSISPFFFGWFGDWMASRGYTGRDQWDPAFYVYVGVLALGALCWLFIDANRSVVEKSAV